MVILDLVIQLYFLYHKLLVKYSSYSKYAKNLLYSVYLRMLNDYPLFFNSIQRI